MVLVQILYKMKALFFINKYTGKKEKKLFLIFIGAKSYLRKGLLVYNDMCKYLVIRI